MNPSDIVIIDDIGLMYNDILEFGQGSSNIGIVIEREDISIYDNKRVHMSKGWRVLINGVDAVFFEEDLIRMESINDE